MILEDICNSSIYKANPFYLLGMSVDVTSRKVRRRQEDFEGFSVMGSKARDREFAKYLLGYRCVPDEEETQRLFERLKEPEYFATEMFFWFWPRGDAADPAVEAIALGDRDRAIDMWRESVDQGGAAGIVSRHNLAVLFHYYAIDGEERLLNSRKAEGSDFACAVDRFWRSSFDLWEQLFDDDDFWEIFSSRVRRLDDPRLDDRFIAAFRSRFPIAFDNINADFMVSYAQSARIAAARRHFDYMSMTMDGADDVEEVMERAFKPMTDKVRVLIRQCANVKKHQDVLAACRKLIVGANEIAAVFKSLVPEGNTFTRNVLNDVVAAVDEKLPLYSRETGDYEPCLDITRDLLNLASTPRAKEKVEKAIKEWQRLMLANTCVVCGTYNLNLQKKDVKFHKDLRPDPILRGRYEWRTRTISVPVCATCMSRFKIEHSKQDPRVKESLSEGWKFGERPSQAEVDMLGLF